MAHLLDMSLDDIIRKNRESSQGHDNRNISRYAFNRPEGSGSGPGPDRRPARRDPPRPRPYPMRAPTMRLPEHAVLGGGRYGEDTGTKLYVSNLDYGVSNEDIQVLFSDVGELISYSIHYDQSGRSKGTAEVIFARQADALAAIQRYNNVQLDGKPLKIELVGVNVLTVSPPTSNFPPGAARNIRNPHGAFRSYHPRTDYRGRGRVYDGGNGRGFTNDQGIGRRGGTENLTAEALDKELEEYRLEAMKLN